MSYVEVAVNSPSAERQTFSYDVPPDTSLAVGQAVWVPFGSRTLQGIVFELTEHPSVDKTREVIDIIDPRPLLTPLQIKLARWISDYYLAPLFEAAALTLPPGFEGGRVKPRMVPHLSLQVEIEVAGRKAELLLRKGAHRQAALLQLLSQEARPIPAAEARMRSGCSAEAITALERKGLISKTLVQLKREPLARYSFSPSTPPTLTREQDAACTEIEAAIKQASRKKAEVYLLRGVTGSGKTEVYLNALAQAVAQGKKGIVLVPEIALTPQTIERFASRFPGKVAVLHSKLSLREQFDEWQQIKEGAFDVVIGPRGAIFAPQPNLGLIVIDEEHEQTYKQREKPPRYHAREVALKLAELSDAVVILGSATPDVESFHQARSGKYRLLELPERITPRGSIRLPGVKVVDMRQELKAGNRSIFSRALAKAISAALNAEEQVILFLNRRGAATFVQCRNCGFVLRCSRCDASLIYHSEGDELVCHQCNHRTRVPDSCPHCGSSRIKFLGAGTQRVAEEVRRAFPTARLLRWDRDTTRGKYSHEEILGRFRSHEADILIGTQMIAKGLDLPTVTLVGVISADTLLHLPDPRAGERTFQLLSQVAGRAGRGRRGGRVIIQTFTPDHYAITAASRHDYTAFYDEEIEYRRQLGNPPFNRLASLTYSHTNPTRCEREAERVYHLLEERRKIKKADDISLLGPTPAYIQRIRGRFRWRIIMRGGEPSLLLRDIHLPGGWAIDIDPASLL